MIPRLRVCAARGVIAAFFFLLAACMALSAGAARQGLAAEQGPDLGPGALSRQLPDGLTVVARQAGVTPVAALEAWTRCPANGFDGSKAGIARLVALALLDEKMQGGSSLRDDVRNAGGQIAISVYQESTQITILAPAYASSTLLDRLSSLVLHPRLDLNAFNSARTRLAAGQVAAGELPDQLLRDALFAQMFSAGPLHDSTYGNPAVLRGLTLADADSFASRAYVPANEIIVAVGRLDGSDALRRIAAAAPASGAAAAGSAPMPESRLAGSLPPASLPPLGSGVRGLALGWVGPPISDEKAATAMDFLSDYLTRPNDGVLNKNVSGLDSTADFSGQFITLRNPGVFFMIASGKQFDPNLLQGALRDGMQAAVGHQLGKDEFEQAKAAFVTHLLRDLQTSQDLADNYGWYYAQGNLTYSPSATGLALSGDYFQHVASLTADYVYSIARKYLLTRPAVVILPPAPVRLTGSSG